MKANLKIQGDLVTALLNLCLSRYFLRPALKVSSPRLCSSMWMIEEPWWWGLDDVSFDFNLLVADRVKDGFNFFWILNWHWHWVRRCQAVQLERENYHYGDLDEDGFDDIFVCVCLSSVGKDVMSESTFRAGISLFTQNCSSIAQSGWASATPWSAHENMWCSTFRQGVVSRLDTSCIMILNLVLHPGGESLVEPEVVPPFHRHEVPKPLIKRRVP